MLEVQSQFSNPKVIRNSSSSVGQNEEKGQNGRLVALLRDRLQPGHRCTSIIWKLAHHVKVQEKALVVHLRLSNDLLLILQRGFIENIVKTANSMIFKFH